VFPAGVPGNYFLSLNVAGVTSATAPSIASFGTGVGLNLFSQTSVRNVASNVSSLSGTTINPGINNASITVPAAGCTITYTPSTIVGLGTTDFFIISLPSTVLTATSPSAGEEFVAAQAMSCRLARLEKLLASVIEGDEEEEKSEYELADIEDTVGPSHFSPLQPSNAAYTAALSRRAESSKEVFRAGAAMRDAKRQSMRIALEPLD